MKRLLLVVLSILIVQFCFSQTNFWFGGSTSDTANFKGIVKVKTAFYIPVRDTDFVPMQIGSMVIRPQDSAVYVAKSLLYVPHWSKVGSAAGGGLWGTITGTLSSQSDLNTALNAKQNSITTGTSTQYLKGNLTLGTFNTDVKTAIGTATFTNPLHYSANTFTIDRSTVGTNGYLAASDFSNFQTGYLKRVTNFAFTGTNTKTLTLTFGDGTTLARTFTDNVASGTSGIVSINGDTSHTHILAVGTDGTDFNIVDTPGGYHQFNIPTIGLSTSRGLLSVADYTTFSNKQNALGVKHSIVKNSDTVKLKNDTSGLKNKIYRQNTVGVSEWDPYSYDSLSNKPSTTNYKKDSVLLYTFNPITTTPTSAGWTKGTNYVTGAVETLVSDGTQIANQPASGGLNVTWSPWKSCAGDVTTYAEYRVISRGVGSTWLGVWANGSTALLGSHNANCIVDLNTSTAYIYTYEFGQSSVGTLTQPIADGDVVRFTRRRNFNVYTFTIYNVTKNVTDVFTRDESTDPFANGPSITCENPGLEVLNCVAVIRDFKYYATSGYNADYMVMGASIQQNAWAVKYDSSFVGRMMASTGKIFTLMAGAGNNDQDIKDILPEVYKMKPKAVIWGDIAYNDIFVSAQPPSVWQPLVKSIIDSLQNHGITVVLERQMPSSNSTPSIINAFIDTVYTNHARTKVFDLNHIFPVWDSSMTNNQNTAYFIDGKHPNKDGGAWMAYYTSRQLEKLTRQNFESAANFWEYRKGRNGRIAWFDSVNNVWRDLIVVGATKTGDSLIFTGGGGGIILSSSDTAKYNAAYIASQKNIYLRNSLASGDTISSRLNDSTYRFKTVSVTGSGTTKTITDSSIVYTLPNFSQSNYTPTVGATTNVTTYTVYSVNYIRVGNLITVSGQIDIQVTAAATNTYLRMSIPIATSSNFSNRRDANGVVNSEAYYGAGVIYGIGSSQLVELSFQASGTAIKDYHFIYTYLVF